MEKLLNNFLSKFLEIKCFAGIWADSGSLSVNANTDYAAGGGQRQVRATNPGRGGGDVILSGTWRAMCGSTTGSTNCGQATVQGIFIRVA